MPDMENTFDTLLFTTKRPPLVFVEGNLKRGKQ